MPTAPNTHDLGDLVRVVAEFRDVAAVRRIDPTVVKLSVLTPSGALTTYTYNVDIDVVRDSLGVYRSDVSADEAGRWYYRWWSTGTGQAAAERYFDVLEAQAIE